MVGLLGGPLRVVCDNCGATYKIPDQKLTRDVNKATCRKCGHTIIIRRASLTDMPEAAPVMARAEPDDRTQVANPSELAARMRAAAEATRSPVSAAPLREEPARPVVVAPAPVVSPAPAVASKPVSLQTSPQTRAAPEPAPVVAAPSLAAAPAPVVAPAAVTDESTDPGAAMANRATPKLAPRREEAPAPVVGGTSLKSASRTHDPAGDFSLVMVASFLGVLGALVLGLRLGAGADFVGLLLALWGGLTAFFVVVVSDRGRRDGKVVLSLVSALVIALVGAGGAAFLRGAPEPVEAVASAPAAPALRGNEMPEELKQADLAPEPEPEPEPEPVVAVVTPPPDVEPEPEPEPAPPQPPPEVKPERRAAAAVSPPPAPKSTTSASTTSASTASAASTKSAPTSAPAPEGVPLTVLDTLLRNNKAVKTCFAVYAQETGAMPRGRITVKIRIPPSGKPDYAGIDGGSYEGTSLDGCLSKAIKGITFPPFSGDSQTVKYPFIL